MAKRDLWHSSTPEGKHTIEALKKENRILRAEVKRLSRIVKTTRIDDESKHNSINESLEAWQGAEKEASLLSSSSYIKYLVSKITGGSLFAFSKKAMGYFRKFRLVSTIMRVISSIIAILGTGAIFIFISGALVFIVPMIVAFCAGIYFLGTVSRTKAFKELERRVTLDTNVYVFFPLKERPFQRGSCFRNTLDIISNDTKNDNFIIVVSPYIFSAVGFAGDGVKFYPVARFEKNNVCIVRRHSFFLLRKRVLGPIEDRTFYIY